MVPNLADWIQKVEVPALGIQVTKVPTPFSSINVGGDHIYYDEITIEYKLDEYLENWISINQWLEAIGFPNKFDERLNWIKERGSFKTEGVLNFLDSKYNGIAKMTFSDMMPTYQSGFLLQTDVEGIPYLSATARFSYTNYQVSSNIL